MQTMFFLGLLFGLASMSTSYMVYQHWSETTSPSQEHRDQTHQQQQQFHHQTPKQLFYLERVEREKPLESAEKNNLLQNQLPFYLTNFESYKYPIEPQKLNTHKTYKHRSYTVDYADSYPRYKFEYGVHDSNSGDFKSHKEERDGDVVRGCYELVEPSGSRRVVTYTSDKYKGFVAVVHQEETSQHEKVPHTAGGQEGKLQEQITEQLIQNNNRDTNNVYQGQYKTLGNYQQKYVQEEQLEYPQHVDKQHGRVSNEENQLGNNKREFRKVFQVKDYGYKSKIALNNRYYQLKEPQHYPQQESNYEREEENSKQDHQQQFQVNYNGFAPHSTSNNQYYQLQQESLKHPQQGPHGVEEQENNKQDYQQQFQVIDNGYAPHMILNNQYYQLQHESLKHPQQEPNIVEEQENNKQEYQQQFQVNDNEYEPHLTFSHQYYQLQPETVEYPQQKSHAEVHQQKNKEQFQTKTKYKTKEQGYQSQNTSYKLQQEYKKYLQHESQAEVHKQNNKQRFQTKTFQVKEKDPHMTLNNHQLQQEPQEYSKQESQAGVLKQNNNQQSRDKIQIKLQDYQPQITANNQFYQLKQEPQKYSQHESQAAQESVQEHQENNKEDFRQNQDDKDQVYEPQTLTDHNYQLNKPPNYY